MSINEISYVYLEGQWLCAGGEGEFWTWIESIDTWCQCIYSVPNRSRLLRRFRWSSLSHPREWSLFTNRNYELWIRKMRKFSKCLYGHCTIYWLDQREFATRVSINYHNQFWISCISRPPYTIPHPYHDREHSFLPLFNQFNS